MSHNLIFNAKVNADISNGTYNLDNSEVTGNAYGAVLKDRKGHEYLLYCTSIGSCFKHQVGLSAGWEFLPDLIIDPIDKAASAVMENQLLILSLIHI